MEVSESTDSLLVSWAPKVTGTGTERAVAPRPLDCSRREPCMGDKTVTTLRVWPVSTLGRDEAWMGPSITGAFSPKNQLYSGELPLASLRVRS